MSTIPAEPGRRQQRDVRVVFDSADNPQTRIDTAIECLLAAMLLFAPAAFGAVETWSEEIVIALAAAIALCFIAKLIIRPDTRVPWSWTYLPILIFLLLAAAQLIPLPAGLLRAISPNTAATKQRLLSDLPNAADALRTMSLTFYASATMRQLRLLLAVVSAFIVVLNIYRRIEPIRRLLATIAMIGGATAILALLQDATRATKIYWTIETYFGEATSGPFVNHSHFCQFMNLSMGAMLALLLLEWHTRYRHRQLSVNELFQQFGKREFQLIWMLGALLLIGAASIALSLSRGGVISMGAAGAATAIFIASKSHVRPATLVRGAIVFAVLAAALFFSFEAASRRIASIRETGAEGSRIQMIKDLSHAWRQYPVLGTGLGTHQYVFPMFDTSKIVAVATHAENEYAQVMTENGGVGLAMVVLFVAIVCASWAHCIRGRRTPSAMIAMGLGYGFLAILIHSATDFGQHIAANAMLTAITCALIINAARMKRAEAQANVPPREFHGWRAVRVIVGIIALILFAAMLWQSDRARAAEAQWRRALSIEQGLRARNWQASDAFYVDLIAPAQRAAELEPSNVTYRYWLDVYRWYSIARWPAELNEQRIQYTRQIVDDLQQCCILCPTFGPAYSMLGQLERFVLNDPVGARHIRLGFELAPNNPIACFVDGHLAALEGDWPTAVARFKHASALSTDSAIEAIDLLVKQYRKPQLALDVAHGNADALDHLATILTDAGARDDQTEQIIRDARAEEASLLHLAAQRPDADRGTLVRAARARLADHDYPTAITYYRRALAQEWDRPDWRFELARALAAEGRKEDAIREAKLAQRQGYSVEEVEKFLKELGEK